MGIPALNHMNATLKSRLIFLALLILSAASFFELGMGSTITYILTVAVAFLAGILVAAEIVARFLISKMGNKIQDTAMKLLRDPDAINELVKKTMEEAGG
jgi:hypothetical protein